MRNSHLSPGQQELLEELRFQEEQAPVYGFLDELLAGLDYSLGIGVLILHTGLGFWCLPPRPVA